MINCCQELSALIVPDPVWLQYFHLLFRAMPLARPQQAAANSSALLLMVPPSLPDFQNAPREGAVCPLLRHWVIIKSLQWFRNPILSVHQGVLAEPALFAVDILRELHMCIIRQIRLQ